MADMVAGPLVGKAVDTIFDKAKKKIDYIRKCKDNVENVKKEVEKLKDMKSKVRQQIDIANNKGDNLIVGVEEWLNKAADEISKAEVFLEDFRNAKKTCFKIGMCGNWANLYDFGKRATTEMMTPLEDHQKSGKDFVTCVSVETRPPTQLDVYQTKNPEDLITHNSALNAIIAALEDESKQIIGIYGLGGVGKTTLANEVVAKIKHLFADVASTTVSQTVNVKKIQTDLENATKRIMKGDKILIILDDVWNEIDLQKVCIPCGNNYMNCKILLTSRSEKVCRKMNAQSKICVNSLPTKEAWILFKRVVGERLETDSNLKPVALKVVEECGGLPLLIQAVGNALKDESIKSWNWALTQLQKHAPLNISDPEIQNAFNHLKLSYDYLKSKEGKSCFLLCSMFPEDFDISLEDLVRYGVGLEMFDDLDSIEDARAMVQNAVNILTSSGLLLKVENEEVTKMHDVVRDVALQIASQGNNKFLVKAQEGLKEWRPRDPNFERYKGISLMYNEIHMLPDYKVNVPHLEIFLIKKNWDLSMISDEFIGCMKKLKVLDISCNNISSLPQSFQLLTKLRMLDLCGNDSLHEISILGVLRDLDILILNKTGITEIPKEIAQLVNLRVLQVKDCVDLSRITPGVISALSRLEELCIDLRQVDEGVNGCTAEVMKLSKLTYLDLIVPSIDDIPEGFDSENLKGFVIQIGDFNGGGELRSRLDRYLIISRQDLAIPLLKWLKKLIEVSCPHIYLGGIKNLNNMMPALYDEGFNKLEHIKLSCCPNVSGLVDDSTRCDGDEEKTQEKFFKKLKTLRLVYLDNLEVMWKCPGEYLSLTNLVTLDIFRCENLKQVFTLSVAQGLVNLKELVIDFCRRLDEVIWGGDDDQSENVMVFPSLAQISLRHLWLLDSFYAGGSENYSIKYPSLVEVEIVDCERMIWGPGIHETPNLKSIVAAKNGEVWKIQLDGPNAINDAVAKRKMLY